MIDKASVADIASKRFADMNLVDSLCALVLTYNRKGLLRDCLNAIQQQTTPCDQIIVVDNASTDGTLDMLLEDFPAVQIMRLRKNVGAAGGFAAGMRLAVATGAERIWVMDDDVICGSQALAELIDALDLTEADGLEPPFVISTAHYPDGQMTDVPEIDLTRNAITGFPEWSAYLGQGLVAVKRATLASILFPRRTFERFGFPLASMFIYGEDAEFTLRVTKNVPGFLSGKSNVQHVRTKKVLNIVDENDPVRLRWLGYLTRNRIYNSRQHRSRISTVKRVVSECRRCVRLLKAGELRKSFIVARGTLAGFWFKPDASDFDMRSYQEAIEYVSTSLQQALDLDVISTDSGRAEPKAAIIDGLLNA